MAAFEYRQAQEIRDAFARHGCRYLFIGKSGAILLGFPDTGQDAELFADRGPENGRALVAALRELGRVVKPGGPIRLLEYVRPRGRVRRLMSRLWEPWMGWAYGAGFDRQTETHVREAGLELVEARYVVDDLVKLISARATGGRPEPA